MGHWKQSEKTLRWVVRGILLGLLVLLVFGARGAFLQLRENVSIIYSVEDMKFFGSKLLEYKRVSGQWPQAETIEELKNLVGATTLERRPRGGFLDFRPALELHSCIYLKGKFQNPGDEVLIWRSRPFYRKGQPHCHELILHEDGHVSSQIHYWE